MSKTVSKKRVRVIILNFVCQLHWPIDILLYIIIYIALQNFPQTRKNPHSMKRTSIRTIRETNAYIPWYFPCFLFYIYIYVCIVCHEPGQPNVATFLKNLDSFLASFELYVLIHWSLRDERTIDEEFRRMNLYLHIVCSSKS